VLIGSPHSRHESLNIEKQKDVVSHSFSLFISILAESAKDRLEVDLRFVNVMVTIYTGETTCVQYKICCTELVHTGANLIPRSATKRIRFVRVTYVRPIVHRSHEHHLHVDGLPVSPPPLSPSQGDSRAMAPLPGLAFRTFTPAPVQVAMCSGQPEYESFSSMWQRSRAWLNAVGK